MQRIRDLQKVTAAAPVNWPQYNSVSNLTCTLRHHLEYIQDGMYAEAQVRSGPAKHSSRTHDKAEACMVPVS